MALSLKEVQPWRADDTLPPGTYVMVLASKKTANSSTGNPQLVVDWRVDDGSQWQGAEKPDWITFTEPALGRIVQFLEAAGIPIPQDDFGSMEELRDWVEGKVKVGRTRVEAILREESYERRNDETGEYETKVSIKCKGYRRPAAASDLDNDASGFKSAKADDARLPF